MNKIVMCFCLACALSMGESKAEVSKNAPPWPDSAPLTKQNVVIPLDGGGFVRVDVLGQRLFRIRYSKTGRWTESGLNRYGILRKTFPEVAIERTEGNGVYTLATKQARLTVSRKDGGVSLPLPTERR